MNIECVGNLPQWMSAGAAGADLIANEDYTLAPGEVTFVDTGTHLAIPDGYFGMLLPRSSIAIKRGLFLINSAGVIDSDFRGELRMAYMNMTKAGQLISKGERIGQILILPHADPNYTPVEELKETVRGEGGWGSTGTGLEGTSPAQKFEPSSGVC